MHTICFTFKEAVFSSIARREVEPWELDVLQAFQAWKGSGKGKFGNEGEKGDGGKGDGGKGPKGATPDEELYETVVEEPPEVTGAMRPPQPKGTPPPPPWTCSTCTRAESSESSRTTTCST